MTQFLKTLWHIDREVLDENDRFFELLFSLHLAPLCLPIALMLPDLAQKWVPSPGARYDATLIALIFSSLFFIIFSSRFFIKVSAALEITTAGKAH